MMLLYLAPVAHCDEVMVGDPQPSNDFLNDGLTSGELVSVALDVHDEHRRVVDLGDVHLVLVGVREHVRGSDVYRHRLELFLDQRDHPGAILGVGFSDMHVALAAALFSFHLMGPHCAMASLMVLCSHEPEKSAVE